MHISDHHEFFRSLVSVYQARIYNLKRLRSSLASHIHAIQGSAVELLYDCNIDGQCRLSSREVMTKRLDLSIQIDEWCRNLDSSMQILQDINTAVWLLETLESERWSIILSTHYHFTNLLINAPVLTMALAEISRHSESPMGVPTSTLHESAKKVLRDDFESAKRLQNIVQYLCSLEGPFLHCNAIWFICNYSSRFHCCCQKATWTRELTHCHYSIHDFTPCLRSPCILHRS